MACLPQRQSTMVPGGTGRGRERNNLGPGSRRENVINPDAIIIAIVMLVDHAGVTATGKLDLAQADSLPGDTEEGGDVGLALLESAEEDEGRTPIVDEAIRDGATGGIGDGVARVCGDGAGARDQ
ncbi:MAG: hypothetical protein AB8F34_12265 [Akkermansiaceae bacterium]